jgi:pimeloyl-ACP methyl ester carboxylesterase
MGDVRARLPDGRVLGWAECGDPDGLPIIGCHGGLSCRLDSRSADEPARAEGVRLIAPDRPGLGLSDPQPGRTLLDWANDVERLADHLEIERFGVYGWSAGGAYALAVGHALADRVTHVAVIAGTTDLSRPDDFSLLAPLDQRLTRLARNHPRRADRLFGAVGQFMRTAPAVAARFGRRSLGTNERNELDRLGGGAVLVENYREATRRGASGMTQDYVTYSGAWGFSAADIAVPVSLWQGTDDSLVTPEFADRLASQIAGSVLHRFDGAGHLLVADRWPTILGSLTGSQMTG